MRTTTPVTDDVYRYLLEHVLPERVGMQIGVVDHPELEAVVLPISDGMTLAGPRG